MERKKTIQPDIFNYLNYRKYLHDMYIWLKEQDKKYSHRYFSKKFNFSSPSYLKMIMDGNRNLSSEATVLVAKEFRLKAREADYLRLIVDLEHAENQDEKKHYLDKIQKIRRRIYPERVDVLSYQALSSWIHFAIREMIFLKNFQGDPAWIKKNLDVNISIKGICSCLNDLLAAGFIERLPGTYRNRKQSISLSNEAYSVALKNYHIGMLERAIESLKTKQTAQREIGAVVAATTREKAALLKERMQEFRKEVMDILSTPDGEGEEVFSFNMQLFRVANGEKK